MDIRPIKFDLKRESLEVFTAAHPGLQIVDQYAKNLEELFLLRNPKYRFDPERNSIAHGARNNYQAEFEKFFAGYTSGSNWFYFPWLNQIVSYLPDAMHQELRTGRNRYLITKEEQDKYYESVIGILGMSVGSHVALTTVMTGGARHIKIADPDTISGDNLNRIRTGFQNVGTNKAVVTARQIFEMNPYAEVEVFDIGLTEDNINNFLSGLNLLVEEMDNPFFKIKVRFRARELGIPVIMAADNGDGIIADVERYDLDKNYFVLHGIIGSLKPEDLKIIAPKDLPRIMAKIAGANIADLKMLQSVLEVGKSIYSWPQLGTAANMCGSILTYLGRRIVLKDSKIQSGRYEVNPDAIFEKDYNTTESFKKRDEERQKYLKMMERD